jgi:DNA-directed RNA polymerase specialized sigma24 family protein
MSDIDTERVWKRYFPRLQLAVTDRLGRSPRLKMHAEDIALSTLRTFFRRVKTGELENMEDVEDLWRLLKTIMIRKTNDLFKREFAQKRGGQVNTIGESQSESSSESGAPDLLSQATAKAPAPDYFVELFDWFNVEFERLEDDFDRDVVLLRLQGATHKDIAEMLECHPKTIQRSLDRIQSLWSK